MNKIIKFFFILLFCIPVSASSADEECAIPTFVLPPIVMSAAVDISEKQCTKSFDDSYMNLVTGCLSGGWKAGASLADGVVELTKLLFAEAPKWVWNEAKKKIDKIRKEGLSPLEMAKSIANVQVASHSEIYAKAQEYWKTFLAFSKNLKNTLMTEIKGFPCLPKFKQSEIICQGVSNVFLTLFTPGAFINGARWSATTGKAVLNFVKESKKIHGLENANLATRLDTVTDYLKGGRASGEAVRINGGVLKTVELPDGQEILQYAKEVIGKDGKRHTVTREVPVDAKTRGIDSNTVVGKEILTGMVSSMKDKGSLIFIDINHLGKVNYFAGGTQTGDKYLASVSEALQKSLRPGDYIFKNGGDELVVVLKNKDPKAVKNISQRMITQVDGHPEIRAIFRKEVKAITDQYKQINNATDVSKIPSSVKSRLSKEELAVAQKDFKKFKTQKLAELKEEMMDQASYRGSVSIGSTMIRGGDSLASTLSRAEGQATKVKAEYKKRMGHDISKYNTTPEELLDIRKWSPPQVLDPN